MLNMQISSRDTGTLLGAMIGVILLGVWIRRLSCKFLSKSPFDSKAVYFMTKLPANRIQRTNALGITKWHRFRLDRSSENHRHQEPFASSVKIGMPNVLWNNLGSSSGGDYDSAQWTAYFKGNCTGCHFDFAPIHYYQDCAPVTSSGAGADLGAQWFKNNVTNAYDVLQLPIWITEFQCYGNDSQQVAFLNNVIPWLDSQSYVERYAYFGVFPGYLINSAGTGLSDIGLAFVGQ